MITEFDIHLGKRLRRRRRLLGLTQQQLAVTVGVRFQQIQKYECGANRVHAERLGKLSEALGVAVGYFYEGYSPESKSTVATMVDAGKELSLHKERRELIEAYNQMSEGARKRILAIARASSESKEGLAA